MDKKIKKITNGCGGKKGNKCQIIYTLPFLEIKQAA